MQPQLTHQVMVPMSEVERPSAAPAKKDAKKAAHPLNARACAGETTTICRASAIAQITLGTATASFQTPCGTSNYMPASCVHTRCSLCALLYLHVAADTEQQAQVHAQRPDVGARLARHPEHRQVSLLVVSERRVGSWSGFREQRGECISRWRALCSGCGTAAGLFALQSWVAGPKHMRCAATQARAEQ